ncbi:unnamed protein product [Gordionus sp. m RMFG-2023]|uniref:uncharacterized protein LOC135928260 n=1 Tax=Gordionus sp. m RMFG-2023 TaxID=3053472 RepID=UPI0030DE1DB3
MVINIGDFVLPGDKIDIHKLFFKTDNKDNHSNDNTINLSKFKHVIGPGIRYDEHKGIIITRFGKLRCRYTGSIKTSQPISKDKSSSDSDDGNNHNNIDGHTNSKLENKIGAPSENNIIKSPSSLYLWVESCVKSYLNPSQGDRVIGVVLKTQDCNILMDVDHSKRAIGAAILPDQAFQGATKRNKPDVKSGDLIYARVAEAPGSGIDPLLTCRPLFVGDPHSPALGVLTSACHLMRSSSNKNSLTDDATTEVALSDLNNGGGISLSHVTGFYWDTSIDHVIKLLTTASRHDKNSATEEDNVVPRQKSTGNLLKMLGQNVPFEIVVGMNGRIWIRSKNVEQTLKVYNVMESLKYLNLSKCLEFWQNILGEPWTGVGKKGSNKNSSSKKKKKKEGSLAATVGMDNHIETIMDC